ncbi:MAG: 30S ribosomal protein S6 [bacterium]|nr:30S ribosomal protein S6 [bacterium]
MTHELLYIVSPSFTDVEVEGVMKKMEALIAGAEGEIKRHQVVSKLPLAYPIKKMKHGTYVLMHFTAPGEGLAKLERTIRLEHGEEVLRHLLTLVTPGQEDVAFEMIQYEYPLAENKRPVASPRGEKPKAAALPPPPPAVFSEPLSVEELDKKLDEILEDDELKTV